MKFTHETNGTSGEELYNGRSTWALVLLGITLFVIIFFTVGGNILVICAPAVNRKLRNVTGMFICSLATADLLLGVIVLPFSAVFEIRRYWDFGPVLCNIYIAFDVMFSTASILNLFAISIDRYVAITDPMTYHQKMTKSRALVIIGIFWVVALLISFLPLHLGWNTDDGNVQNYDDPTNCGLKSNPWYSLIDGILLFFLPLTIMGCLYFRILLIARKQARTINAQSVRLPNQHHNSSNGGSPDANHSKHSNACDEHKATKMLATIMGCFIVCWVPYFSMFTFIPLFTNAIIPTPLYMVALWLGYCNSTCNPLLYAALNGEFRKAFRKLLFRSKGATSFFRSEPASAGTHMELTTHNSSPRNSKQNNNMPDTSKTKYGMIDGSSSDEVPGSSHIRKIKSAERGKVKH